MDVLELYRRTGALLEGHFLLRSGLHSPIFLQSAALLQHPLYAEAVGEALGKLFEDEKVDFVIGPALGGWCSPSWWPRPWGPGPSSPRRMGKGA